MIPLIIKAISRSPLIEQSRVIRLVQHNENLLPNDYEICDVLKKGSKASSRTNTIFFPDHTSSELANDILVINPERQLAQRLIRHESVHNTFLVTEQCDQLCVMCSQPPKKYHNDQYEEFIQAALLAPKEAIIGISGGEPMLHKEQLYEFLSKVVSERPDIKFHVLTNGQHFSHEDISILRKLAPYVLWGVPLYATNSKIHDQIVGKLGAHQTLLDNFSFLLRTGSRLEIRTVVMQQNSIELPLLSRYIAKHLASAEVWAIMQLESIGFARKNWFDIFFDTSKNFSPVAKALRIAAMFELNAQLYNFPLCTVPSEYREYAVAAISDWKNKFLPECYDCKERGNCGGFFEWYNPTNGFEEIKSL